MPREPGATRAGTAEVAGHRLERILRDDGPGDGGEIRMHPWREDDVRQARSAVAAFTLVEMLIVVTCAGIIAAAAFPGIAHVVNDDSADRAASLLAGAIRYAQAEAARTGRTVGVEAVARRAATSANGFDDGNWFRVFDSETSASLLHPVTQRRYRIDFDDDAVPVTLSSVAAGAGGMLSFNPAGDPSMAGASYVVQAGVATRTVTVRGATGWVVVK